MQRFSRCKNTAILLDKAEDQSHKAIRNTYSPADCMGGLDDDGPPSQPDGFAALVQKMYRFII
jgi:hypothetical protein